MSTSTVYPFPAITAYGDHLSFHRTSFFFILPSFVRPYLRLLFIYFEVYILYHSMCESISVCIYVFTSLVAAGTLVRPLYVEFHTVRWLHLVGWTSHKLAEGCYCVSCRNKGANVTAVPSRRILVLRWAMHDVFVCLWSLVTATSSRCCEIVKMSCPICLLLDCGEERRSRST